jgi:hypothetical protein
MNINKRFSKILSEYFKDNIRLSLVELNNIIIVTKDDNFYQFDEFVNKSYTSTVYTSDESLVKTLIEKLIVEELCDKRVIDIKNSLRYTIALTSDQKVCLEFVNERLLGTD